MFIWSEIYYIEVVSSTYFVCGVKKQMVAALLPSGITLIVIRKFFDTSLFFSIIKLNLSKYLKANSKPSSAIIKLKLWQFGMLSTLDFKT